MTQPLRKTVFLPSAGLNERRATLHTYSHSELIQVRGDGGKKITGMAHFFRCTVTGELRQWGFDADKIARLN